VMLMRSVFLLWTLTVMLMRSVFLLASSAVVSLARLDVAPPLLGHSWPPPMLLFPAPRALLWEVVLACTLGIAVPRVKSVSMASVKCVPLLCALRSIVLQGNKRCNTTTTGVPCAPSVEWGVAAVPLTLIVMLVKNVNQWAFTAAVDLVLQAGAALLGP